MDYENNIWQIVDALGQLFGNEHDENFTILAYMLFNNVINENAFICNVFSYIDEKYTGGLSKRIVSTYKTVESFDALAVTIAAVLVCSKEVTMESSHELFVVEKRKKAKTTLVQSLYNFQIRQRKNDGWKAFDFACSVDFMTDWILQEHHSELDMKKT